MSEATDSTSETMWVDSITTRSAASSLSRLRRRTRSSGSRPAVGSSTTITRGSASSACAMPTRRSMPPEYAPSGRLTASVRLTSWISSSIRARAERAPIPLAAAR